MFVLLRVLASIFYQILYMSIIATVIGLVIFIIQKIIDRRISPKYKYIIWLVFVILLLFPISISSKFSVYNFMNFNFVKIIDDKNVHLEISNNEKKDNIEISNNALLNNIDLYNVNFKIILADMVILLSILKVAKLIILYKCYFNNIEKSCVENNRVLKIFEECKKELNISKNIKIVNIYNIDSPAIIGVFKVKVLFSDKLLKYDDNSLKNMFLHELAHYKRKDNLMNFLIIILSAIYWFNPIVTHMFKYIKQNMEFATDELAIKNMNIEETRDYCKTIVDVEENRSSKFIPILTFAGELEYMEKRIDFISLKNSFKRISKITAFLTAGIILVLCLVFYPTSYCSNAVPKLYLQTEDGLCFEVPNSSQIDNFQEITIKKGTMSNIISNNISQNCNIYFNCIDVTGEKNTEKNSSSIINNRIKSLKKGKYIYKFKIVTDNNRTFNYEINIKVV